MYRFLQHICGQGVECCLAIAPTGKEQGVYEVGQVLTTWLNKPFYRFAAPIVFPKDVQEAPPLENGVVGPGCRSTALSKESDLFPFAAEVKKGRDRIL